VLTPSDRLFRDAALARAARPQRRTPNAEIPRPPLRSSLCTLAALAVAAIGTALYVRVPEYASGFLIAGPANTLIVAVPETPKSALEPGRAVVAVSPSAGTLVRSQLTRVVGVTNPRWLDARVRLDAAGRPEFGGAVAVAYARPGPSTLGPAGTVLPARVEIARDTLFSQLPLVGRLG
jgi:hypothetical protein